MNANEYQKLAGRTECDQLKAADKMHQHHDLSTRLNHTVFGLAGEVGELAGAIERWIYYGQDLDAVNVREELGDCLWYIALACNAMGSNMSDLMASNIAKLKQRYPEKFSEEKALEENRDRQAEAKAIKSGCDAIVKANKNKILDSNRVCSLARRKAREAEETEGAPIISEFNWRLPESEIQKLRAYEATETSCPACDGNSMCNSVDPPIVRRELCSLCELVELHKLNRSGLCADCAADVRALQRATRKGSK